MSRSRTVKGKYVKITNGDHNMSSEGHIISKAVLNVGEKGTAKGVTRNNYERLGSNVNEDFEITFSLEKGKTYSTLVPLGILDFEGKDENANFVFNYSLMLSNIDSLDFKILNEDGSTLYTVTNLPEVVVSARRMPLLVEDIFKKKPKYDPFNPKKTWDSKSIFDPYNISSNDYTKIGSYVIFWDGFDNDEIYDSTNFNNKKLKAQITATKNGNKKTKEVEFFTERTEVDWVDVKIDKKNKRIDTTLRVNLKDGGEQGLSCSSTAIYKADYEEASQRLGVDNPIKDSTITFCDWDKVSKEAIAYYKREPIKKRTKSFTELKDLALKGINEFWSRNSSNIGKGVNLNETLFETFVDAILDEKGMIAPKIIYFTNSEETDFTRSHNFELHRELYYYEGYTYHKQLKTNKTKGWKYKVEPKEIFEFKHASAHEIGHQLLFDYGKGGYDGRDYSYSHKQTSGPTWVQQDPLPGTKFPEEGEIDLMKYAEGNDPIDYFKRVILSTEDSLGLIWLSKLKIIGILCIIGLLCSCRFKDPKQIDKGEFANYFNGIVLDEKNKPIENVKVTVFSISFDNGKIEKDSIVITTFTNNKGYFGKNSTKINYKDLEIHPKILVFQKKGYKTDTIDTYWQPSSYRNEPEHFYFIYKIPDTLILKK